MNDDVIVPCFVVIDAILCCAGHRDHALAQVGAWPVKSV